MAKKQTRKPKRTKKPRKKKAAEPWRFGGEGSNPGKHERNGWRW